MHHTILEGYKYRITIQSNRLGLGWVASTLLASHPFSHRFHPLTVLDKSHILSPVAVSLTASTVLDFGVQDLSPGGIIVEEIYVNETIRRKSGAPLAST
ncbi:hypothetical protein Dsin_028889 [Dipteronia sinensis]|uniref:Uncharacterized protein n=1 Tax=Dipteronia sinensis TaxID=43782 RepID=A0AAD9ZRA9_9ROSI|nr:hypothetical protein Dsin_028889 [Dipteronia sinensis]